MAMRRKVVLGMILALAGVSVAGYAVAQADVIKERQAGFKQNGASMKAIKTAIDAGGPASAVVAPAETILNWSTKIVAHFPKGSDKGDTKAKPEIWANFAEFEKLAKNNHDAAEKMVAAAKAGDMDAVKAGFGPLGGTCGACHKQFRAEMN